jgi:molybdate transport system ATP-binding protein
MGGVAVEVKSSLAASSSLIPMAHPAELSVDIRKRFATDGEFELDLKFATDPGITILFGASGAGKTTLLNCIAGLTSPDDGRITVGDQVFFESARNTDLRPQRRRVGYVFQDLALFPHLSVEKNVEYGLFGLDAQERNKRCNMVLESMRVVPLRGRKPNAISGGERQRVALARALVVEPRVLLLDEPLAALDAVTKSGIIDDLRAWNRAHSIPILYVTHSREEVFALGERVMAIDAGRCIAEGTPHEVMSAPRHETVAQLAGFENVFDVRVTAAHEDRGTMTCRIAPALELETPLVRAQVDSKLRVGIRAGDILLAIAPPHGLSARNVIPGELVRLEQRDVMVVAHVNCGAGFVVHLTLAARDSLALQPGRKVWLIVKTHSCHLLSA